MSNHTIPLTAGPESLISGIKLYLIGFIISLFIISGFGTDELCFAADKKVKPFTSNKMRHKIASPKTPKKSSIKHSKPRKTIPVSTGVQAKAVYCVNLANNQTLINKNADEKLPIASLTKLVTALLTLDHMPLDKRVTVPEHIKKVPKSVVGLKPGDTLSVEDLLRGMLISSGNDCAETLACAFPGGKPQFIAALNKKARSLGATNTRFFTPSGLDKKTPNSSSDDKDPEVDSNVSTAREIANITRIAFANKTIRSICQTRSCVLKSTL
ncbi:MAG: serine hydrolase, partial [Pseudomonadota bacterium]